MTSRRSWKKFLNTFIILFLVYLLVVPAFFFILDTDSAVKAAKKNWGNFFTKIAGIALLISFVIALWSRKDPALRNW